MRRSLFAFSSGTLVAGLLLVAPPAASQEIGGGLSIGGRNVPSTCDVSDLSPDAWAEATGVVSDLDDSVLPGASVYTINTETGETACAISGQDGTYRVDLVGSGSGDSLRPASDYWLIIANPPLDSALASNSVLVRSSSVTAESTVAGQNLELGAATVSTSITINEDDTSGIACLYTEDVAPLPLNCAMTQVYAGNALVARVSVPSGATYYLDGWAYRDGVRYLGFLEDELTASSSGSFTVPVSADFPDDCVDPLVTAQGTVVKTVNGQVAPAQAQVAGVVLTQGGPEDVLGGWTNPQGEFRACAPWLPNGADATSVLLGYTSVLGGSVHLRSMFGTDDTSRRNLQLDLSAPLQLGGRILASGVPQVGTEWNIAQLANGMPGPPLLTTSGRTDGSGAWGLSGLLIDGSYALLAYPANDDNAHSVAVIPFTISEGELTSIAGTPTQGPVLNADVPLPLGNVTGRAVRADGAPQAFSPVMAQYCVDPNDENSCGGTGTRTNADGRFALSLPASGTYGFSVTVAPRWPDTSVTTTEASGTISDGVSTPLAITMRAANGAFKVQNSATEPLADARISLMSFTGNVNEPWDGQNGQWTQANGDGLAYVSFDDSGVYRLEVSSTEQDYGPTVELFLDAVVADDGSLSLQQCSRPLGGTIPCAGDKTPFSQTDGAWVVTRPDPNVAGILKDPSGEAVVPWGEIQIQKSEGQGYQWFGHANSNDAGQVALFLPEGDFSLTFAKPYDSEENWASRVYYVTSDGTNACIRQTQGTTCTPTAPVVDEIFTLRTANIIGTVEDFSGNRVNSGWIEIFRSCGDGCEEWLTGAQISGGTFSLNLDADDTYTLTAQGFGLVDGSVRTTFSLYVAPGQTYTPTFRLKGANVSGRITDSGDQPVGFAQVQVERKEDTGDYVRWTWVNSWTQTDQSGNFSLFLPAGTYRLRIQPPAGQAGITSALSEEFNVASDDATAEVNVSLAAPNVVGTVSMPNNGGPASYAWVQVRRWNPDIDQYEWTEDVPGTSTDASGVFSMSLPSGRWELMVNPPWGSATASATNVDIVVDGAYFCLGTNVCTEENRVVGDGGVSVILSAPNVTGAVKFANNAPAGNTWIEVRRYDSGTGRYDWSSDLPGVNVNFDGTFATTLPDGDYRLTANPPWGNTTATRASLDITVDGDAVCLTVNKASCGDNDVNPIVITLGSPNVNGTVTAGGQPVSNSNLNVEKWNADTGQWFWQEIWGNSNSSGVFSFNLSDDGVYRISAQPTSATAEYSAGQGFVYVSGGQLCSSVSEQAATSESPCSLAAAPLSVTVALKDADLVGTVTDGSNSVRDAWVSLLKLNDSGWFDWLGGTSTRSGGAFALSLDSGGSSKTYRLEVFPPWNSNGELSRKKVDIVAYDDAGATRICEAENWDGSECSAAVSRLTVTLSSGNVRGNVKVPGTDDTGVREAQISVEKWVEAPWNPGSGQYVWQWADLYTDSRSGGSFALPIDEPGVFRLTARPPWNNSSGWSSGRSIISVNGAGQWCSQTPTTSTTADAFGACEGSLSTDASRLEMRLSTPNVSTQIEASGQSVQDAWVTLIRETVRVVPGGTQDDTYVSRDWVAGTSTNAQGNALFNVDVAGSYLLEINPPWQSNAALSRFTQSFTVTCAPTCVTSGLDAILSFPTPNVGGLVLDPSDSSLPVRNAWVMVEREVGPGVFQWTDQGTATNGRGRYMLALADGTYRVTANPAWDRPVGIARRATITVTGGVATCVSGCLANFDIQLQGANVTGSLVYGSPSAPMPYGWIEVTDPDTGAFIDGASSGVQGDFSLFLNDDTYTFRAYPNWNLAAKPPVSTTVVVSGGQVVSVGGIPANSVRIDFDAVTPSLVVTVAGNVTGKRFVAVEKDQGGGVWVQEPDLTAVATDGLARLGLEVGTYRITVVPDIGKTATNNTAIVIITDPSVQESVTINPSES